MAVGALKFLLRFRIEMGDLAYDPPLCAICGHEDFPFTSDHRAYELVDGDWRICSSCYERLNDPAWTAREVSA